MPAASCPLCHLTDTTVLETIQISELAAIMGPGLWQASKEDFRDCNEMEFRLCPQCGLKFFIPPVSGSAEVYEHLQKGRHYYLSEKPEYQLARKYMRPTDTVLDVGAGRGAFARDLTVAGYTGLEFSDAAIAMAGEAGVKLKKQSVEDHAVECVGCYDVVCSFQVLEHVVDVRGFLDASVRCLKPGGRLICSVPSDDSYVGLMENATMNLPPHHLTRWSDRCLRNVGSLLGLELVEIVHDCLDEVHKKDYATMVAAGALRGTFSPKAPAPRIVTGSARSFRSRLFMKVARWVGGFYARGLRDKRLLPWGHSVTAIYEKPA